MKKYVAVVIAMAFAAAACNGSAEADEGSGSDRVRGPAFVEDVQFVFLESYPVQVRATIVGNLPTPCHEAVAEVTDSDGTTVTVDVYSLVDPQAVCAEVLDPFEVTVEVGSFETGEYVLIIGDAEYPFTI